jgi:hypothetical protein
MNSSLTDKRYYTALNRYKRNYLIKKFENLDESSTRLLINHLLTDVLGYKELVDIKIEYPIKGGYIDYLIELNNKKLLIIEAKSIKTRLTNKHLRQAIYYGTMVGVKWIVLTNARYVELYKISYNRPIIVKLVFSIDIKKLDNKSKLLMSFLSKRSLINGELDKYLKIYETLSIFN